MEKFEPHRHSPDFHNLEIGHNKNGRYLVTLDAPSVDELRRGLDVLRNDTDRDHILSDAEKFFGKG